MGGPQNPQDNAPADQAWLAGTTAYLPFAVECDPSFPFPEAFVRPPVASVQTAGGMRARIPGDLHLLGLLRKRTQASVTEAWQQKGAVVVGVWSREGGRRERGSALTDSWPVPGTCQTLCSH